MSSPQLPESAGAIGDQNIPTEHATHSLIGRGVTRIAEHWKGLSRKGRAAEALGLTVLALAGATEAVWLMHDKSGSIVEFSPDTEVKGSDDDKLRLISWNVAGQAGRRIKQINWLLDSKKPDALLLQEVWADDMKKLERRLKPKGIYGKFVWASGIQNIKAGGMGNAIFTWDELGDTKSYSFEGAGLNSNTSKLAVAATWDIATFSSSFARFKDELQEDRAALFGNLNVTVGGRDVEVRVGNTHLTDYTEIGGEAVEGTKTTIHRRQFRGFRDVAEDNSIDGRPTVIGADFNEDYGIVRNAYTPKGYDTAWSPRPTNLDGDKPDHFVYFGGSILGRPNYKVLQWPHTDHYPIQITFKGGSSGIAGEYQ